MRCATCSTCARPRTWRTRDQPGATDRSQLPTRRPFCTSVIVMFLPPITIAIRPSNAFGPQLVDGARASRTPALAEDVEAQRGAVPLHVARRADRQRIVGAHDRERGAVRALVRDTDRRPAGDHAAQHVRQLEARLDLVSARLQQRLALLRVRDEGRHGGSHEGANGAKDRTCALPAAVSAKKPSTTDRDLVHDPAGQEREKAVRRP